MAIRSVLRAEVGMALSMDEQHILAEIEERLTRSEPALAAQFSSFGGPVAAARPPRALILASFATLIVMAFVSLMLYALVPFRAQGGSGVSRSPATAPAHPAMSARQVTGAPTSPAARHASPTALARH